MPADQAKFPNSTAADPSCAIHVPKPIGHFILAAAGIKPDRGTRSFHQRGDSPRSGAPVWRNSYTVGQIENRIWKPINGGTTRGGKRWAAALLKAAKRFELVTRAERQQAEPGARNGALGPVAIAVLEYLYGLVDFATGRLEPAVRTIAEAVGHAYSAVHNALKRLREHGFLHWMRRSRPKDDPQPGSAIVEQASNAYALLVPEGLRAGLQRLLGKAPAPECEVDRRKRETAAFDAMLEGLTAEKRHDATWNGDSLVGETLKKLAAAVDRRDRRTCESSTTDETGVI
ncbi:hypothetical protein [Sphingomonas sp. IW22]|uniref:hypothetical protein n=1 Tax=Sphingomonas sp. IW22 TaxID=3242489 RepID=UPI0035203CFC